VREACSEVHSLTNWPSGRAFTYKVEMNLKRERSLNCDFIEEIVILWLISFIERKKETKKERKKESEK
jgi:hypothetical protein